LEIAYARGHAVSESLADTQSLAAALAAELAAGDVVCLYGDLGAGKTYFTKGLVAGLGGEASEVNSPTFVLMQTYSGHLPVYHFDAYRLHGGVEMLDLGIEEIIGGDGVTVIEWADRVAEVLPAERYDVRLSAGSGPESRLIVIAGSGERQAAVVRGLLQKGALIAEL
jgi:tRNA threonylcarbamoyladenosine biosynthesis protein TsaE